MILADRVTANTATYLAVLGFTHMLVAASEKVVPNCQCT